MGCELRMIAQGQQALLRDPSRRSYQLADEDLCQAAQARGALAATLRPTLGQDGV